MVTCDISGASCAMIGMLTACEIDSEYRHKPVGAGLQ